MEVFRKWDNLELFITLPLLSKKELFITICWRIWLNRNEANGEPIKSGREIVKRALYLFDELFAANLPALTEASTMEIKWLVPQKQAQDNCGRSCIQTNKIHQIRYIKFCLHLLLLLFLFYYLLTWKCLIHEIFVLNLVDMINIIVPSKVDTFLHFLNGNFIMQSVKNCFELSGPGTPWLNS